MAIPTPRSAPYDLKSPPIMSSKGTPSCVQRAFSMKEKKPFTYTPGGLDLSEIKSEKMARRLMRNAMSPGVPETPKSPNIIPNGTTLKTPVNYYNMPVAVFPMIQIPQNPKELLRRTSGPHRRDSFESDVSSPKVQEKPLPATPMLDKNDSIDVNNDNMEEKSIDVLDVKLELKENIPIPENEIQVKKTSIKVKKNKEKSGMKLKRKNSSSNKSDKSNEGTIIKIKEEKKISTIEYTICDKRSDVEKEQTKLDLKNIIDICKSNSLESEKTTQVNEETQCRVTTQREEIVESRENKDIETKIDVNITNSNEKDSKEVRIKSEVFKEDVTKQSENVEKNEQIEETKKDSINQIEESKDQQDEGDVTPKIDIITHQFEIPLRRTSKQSSETTHTLSSIEQNSKSEEYTKSETTLRCNNMYENFKRENSSQITSRRKSENIKSLNTDLDSLPSLNLCSKRFSFLRESPSKDDPFSILTGLTAKISLGNNDKKTSLDDKPKTGNILFSDKSDENIPKHDKYTLFNDKTTFNEDCKSNNSSFSKINGYSTPSSISDDGKNSNVWTPPKLFNDFSFNIEEDNLPAWKKELLEIANKKKEINEECEYYKEEVEPPWRRELRELAQSRLLRESAPSYNVWNKLAKAVELSSNEESSVLPNPVWSQTLKQKTWKERKADLSTEKEVEVPEWKNATALRRNFMNSIINKSTSSSSSCSSPAREVRKTPEITIEITGQPIPAQENRTTSNGYTYPWESSSESSTTFSPEPYTYERTPTPQSRSSPFTQNHSGLQSPVVAREYGTLSYQPNKRHQIRSCPIQSRSFKYLQMLTGTSDGYDDDEPFIPQSPQHAHLRPDNV